MQIIYNIVVHTLLFLVHLSKYSCSFGTVYPMKESNSDMVRLDFIKNECRTTFLSNYCGTLI